MILHETSRAAPWLLVGVGFLNWAAIFAAIWDALKWLAEKAAIIAIAVAKAVAKAAVYTWNAIKFIGVKLKDAAEWLRDRLSDLARWWKEKAAPWLVKALGKIQDWFKRHFGWLFNWVHRIQSILQWVYKHILRPALIFLEVTRLVLRLLASLGVKWAKRLDDALGRLEQKLLNVFLTITRFVNDIASILDVLFNTWGAVRRSLFLWSLWAYVGEISALMRISHIDHDPWPEALALAQGPDPLDLPRKGIQLEEDLLSPPGWAILAGRELEDLLA